MRTTVPAWLFGACLFIAPLAFAAPSTPEAFYEFAHRMASERLQGVDHYVERIKGNTLPGLHEALGPDGPKCVMACRVTKVEEVESDGDYLKVPRLLSPEEAYVLAGISPDSQQMVGMSLGYQQAQDAFSANADEMLGPWAGIAETLLGDIPEDSEEVARDIDNRSWEQDERETPWLNPFRMFGAGSYMLAEGARATADAEASLAASNAQAAAQVQMMRAYWANAEMAGTERLDGKTAVLIKAPVPEQAAQQFAAQSANEPGQPTFIPRTSTTWIEEGTYALLKHRLDGTAIMDGQKREFYIENANEDYRQVPGSDLYLPYRRVMRMGGVLNDEQMQQMKEAQQQLAEFDRELAAMPADQRRMVENMMGGQMDTIRNMARSGAFEYVEEIEEIFVNPNLRELFEVKVSAAPATDNLLARIQQLLATLGYSPGNTDGNLDTMTQIAISQYQAEAGLAVTGEPGNALLDALENSVANQ